MNICINFANSNARQALTEVCLALSKHLTIIFNDAVTRYEKAHPGTIINSMHTASSMFERTVTENIRRNLMQTYTIPFEGINTGEELVDHLVGVLSGGDIDENNILTLQSLEQGCSCYQILALNTKTRVSEKIYVSAIFDDILVQEASETLQKAIPRILSIVRQENLSLVDRMKNIVSYKEA